MKKANQKQNASYGPKIIWTEKTVKVDQLKPYGRNPRIITKEAYDRLKKAISEMGFHQRMLCQPDFSIIGGHQRLKALQELGFDEVQVLVPDRKLTTKEFRQLLIQDNLPFGSHDFEILAADFEIEELVDWGMPEKWLVGHADEDGEKEPEEPVDVMSQAGDIWLLGDHQLTCGDSAQKEDVARWIDHMASLWAKFSGKEGRLMRNGEEISYSGGRGGQRD